MPSFIEKLREKSPEEKKKITIWAAVVITVLIAVLWIIFFFPRGNGSAPAGSFLGNIGQSFNEAIKSVKK